MNVLARICMGLAAFLLVGGLVYGVTSHERAGTTLLIVAGGTFLYLTLVSRSVAQRAAAGPASEHEELHIAPTIWPFGFAVAAVIIALGLIVSRWILIPGVIAFALSAAGWLRDVTRSHEPAP